MGLTLAQIAAYNKNLKVANGKWELAPVGNKNEWNGTCGRCMAVVPAVKLKLVILPFGKGERYECGECR